MLMTWKIRECFLFPNFKNFSKIIFSLRYFCTSFWNLHFSSNFEVYKKGDYTWGPLKLRLKVYDQSVWGSFNFKIILILMVKCMLIVIQSDNPLQCLIYWGYIMNIDVIVLFVGSDCLEDFIQQSIVWFFLAENGGKCARTVYIYIFHMLIFPPLFFPVWSVAVSRMNSFYDIALFVNIIVFTFSGSTIHINFLLCSHQLAILTLIDNYNVSEKLWIVFRCTLPYDLTCFWKLQTFVAKLWKCVL